MGGPEVLTTESRSVPTSDAQGALVQIKASAIDYLDIYQSKGAYREHQTGARHLIPADPALIGAVTFVTRRFSEGGCLA